MASPRLSALVVVHNEEAQLAECLERLRFADEIVVVLDDCSDGSKAIAETFSATLVEGKWEIEGARRNEGIDASMGDWILEVDADERVTPELAAELCRAIDGAAPGYFLIPFHNYIGDRLVRYGWGASWGTGAKSSLFSRDAKRWGAQRVHPGLELKGVERRLRSAMVHYIDRDISDMIQRLDRYTALRARDLRASGNMGSFATNLRRLFSRFFKCYVVRKGYREGAYGFLIALFAGLFPLLSHLKATLETESTRAG